MSKTQDYPTVEWKNIPWQKLERVVFKLQKRIYKASQLGDVKAVRKLQKTLLKSWSAKCVAVQLVNTQAEKTTSKDLALQALVKLAIEPEWQAKFAAHPGRLRPGKSPQDAIAQISQAIEQKPKYVLTAEIADFDNINHQVLLQKLNTFPSICRLMKAWLKAGLMEGKKLVQISSNLSWLLLNIALDGIEQPIEQAYLEDTPELIIYGNQFVVLHQQISALQRCRELISEWLQTIGLSFRVSKTRLSHTLTRFNSQIGFDFLGFHIQQYKSRERQKGYQTRITPSSSQPKKHYRRLVSIINTHKSAPQQVLIGRLNPVIQEWVNYYSPQVSKKTLAHLDHLLFLKLITWAKRRHPKKSRTWVSNKYWQSISSHKKLFASKYEGENSWQLIRHAQSKAVGSLILAANHRGAG
ncbi:MAG: reverse transcriptase N-terminal domain-containing protein [Coleofasciculaceae cyanobacterium]